MKGSNMGLGEKNKRRKEARALGYKRAKGLGSAGWCRILCVVEERGYGAAMGLIETMARESEYPLDWIAGFLIACSEIERGED